MGAEAVFETLADFGNLFLILNNLAQSEYLGRSLDLLQLNVSCFVGIHGRPSISEQKQMRNRLEVLWEHSGCGEAVGGKKKGKTVTKM